MSELVNTYLAYTGIST